MGCGEPGIAEQSGFFWVAGARHFGAPVAAEQALAFRIGGHFRAQGRESLSAPRRFHRCPRPAFSMCCANAFSAAERCVRSVRTSARVAPARDPDGRAFCACLRAVLVSSAGSASAASICL